MITNADITIFNKRRDADGRTERFYPTKIKGVSFVKKRGTAFTNQEGRSNDTYAIRIPMTADFDGKSYIPAGDYAALADESFSDYWTLQTGAYIVKGLSDLENATETVLMSTYPDVVLINDFTNNTDRCSESMRHWRIGGT